MESRTYKVGRSRITLKFGDITSSKAEVLVSSDDYLLSMGGGVSAALRRHGGPGVRADASKMVPAKLGDVVVASGTRRSPSTWSKPIRSASRAYWSSSAAS